MGDMIEGEEVILDEEYFQFRNISLLTSSLHLSINTSSCSLLGLHETLPNLCQLTLDGSTIVSIRDLGTKLDQLTYLHINDCGVSDLDGIGAFPHLVELSACNNQINDLSCLAMHSSLQVLFMNNV